MSNKNINLLIQKYYDATISSEEEKILCSYFVSDQVSKEHVQDQSIFLALQNRSAYWNSNSENLKYIKIIDQVIEIHEKEKKEDKNLMQMIDRFSNHSSKQIKNKKNLWIYAAAILILILSISFPIYKTILKPTQQPREMTYEEYKKSLLLVSQKLNQGADQADKANKYFKKIKKNNNNQ